MRDTHNKAAVRRCRAVCEASSSLRRNSEDGRTRPATSLIRGLLLQGDGADSRARRDAAPLCSVSGPM